MASKTNLPSYLFGSSDVSDDSGGSVSSDSSDSCDNSDQKSFFTKKNFFYQKTFFTKKKFVHQQLFSLNKNHQQIVFPKELLFTKNSHQRTVVTNFFLM